MKRIHLSRVPLCTLRVSLGVAFCAVLAAQSPIEDFGGRPAAANQVLVRLTSNDAISRGLLQLLADADVVQTLSAPLNLHLVHSRSKNIIGLLTALAAHTNLLYVQPDYIVRAVGTPNDPSFSSLWGLKNTGQVGGTAGADISATAAWDRTTGSTANVIGVVDTGIDYTHPDLAANVWSAPQSFNVTIAGTVITCPAGSHGFNAIANTCDPRDDNNHGTHVSGTIGAVGNNGVGVVGVNWTTRIMGLKFLDAAGSGLTSRAINAIEFAVQTKAAFAVTSTPANVRVLSNSWSGNGSSTALADEINRANTNDILFVAAAGNDGTNNDTTPRYPASYTAPNVIAVAATTVDDTIPSFSNFGATSVDLSAPGVGILSTVMGGGYASLGGTSMATPHVAGAAMLILSACSLNTAELKGLILGNVDPVPSQAGKTVTGGRLNVNRAITACAAAPAFTLSAAPASVNSGGTVTVNWTAPAGRPPSDWIGLFQTGTTSNQYLWWIYTGGSAAGSSSLVANLGAGTYEFRYFLNGGYTEAARSGPVTVLTASGPVISSVAPTGITSNSVNINWTTNVGADSQVDYGTTASYGSSSPLDSTLVTSHAVSLSGLSPSTTYHFRVKSRNASGVLGSSGDSTFTTAGGAAYSLLASPASVTLGSPVTLTWTAPGGSPSDWVGLFLSGSPNTAFQWYGYTGGATSGSFTVTPPSVGTYEFRYLPNNGYTDVARSNSVNVTAGSSGYTLTASPSTVSPAGTITANWTAPSGSPGSDWLGLYLTGTSNVQYLWYRFTGGGSAGTVTLTAPSTPGTYELRYLTNYSYVDVARSGPITVR